MRSSIASNSVIISVIAALVGLKPRLLMTVPRTDVSIRPSLSLSKRRKASLKSLICLTDRSSTDYRALEQTLFVTDHRGAQVNQKER